MTAEEKTALLDAIDKAEADARARVKESRLVEAEVVVLRLAAQIRAAVHAAETGELTVRAGT